MIFLAGFWDNVGSAILEALRSLMLNLCDIIYKLIVFFFDIFLILGDSSILEDSIVNEIYHRVGLILGLFMVFRVIFSLIQYVMNPDTMFDKQKGVFNIVKRMFIVVVLLGTTPYIFDMAFDAQHLIIDSNIIPKVITGKNVGTEDFGSDLAWYTFSSFYKFDDRVSETDKLKCDVLSDGVLENDFKANNTLDYAYNCVNEKVKSPEKEKIFLIDFTGGGLIAVLVGVLILWMIIMYVIQVGVRVVQLAYLELIAPIPIIGYLAPKGEDTFNKWVKQCTTTYLDFFIRIGVIYLVVFIIGLLIGNDSQHFVDSLGNTGGWDMLWINIIMIIALLIVAKKVPNLLKELFPMTGGAAKFDFGIKSPKQAWKDYVKDPITGIPVAGKAIGWMGNKAATAVSAPIKRGLDVLKQNRKNRIDERKSMYDARLESRENDKKYKLGENLYKSYVDSDGNEHISDAFESDYAETYSQLSSAKKNASDAASALKNAEEAYSVAYSSGDAVAIKKARDSYDKAVKSKADADKFVKLAQDRHDVNRKKYAASARKEDAFSYYKNVQKLSKLGQDSSGTQQQQSQQTVKQQPVQSHQQSQQPSQKQTGGGQQIKPEDVYVSAKDIDDAYQDVYDLIGTGASQEEIDQQLQWIDTITKENDQNLEDAYQKLYDLTGTGASQEEIDAQLKKINDIKPGEIK